MVAMVHQNASSYLVTWSCVPLHHRDGHYHHYRRRHHRPRRYCRHLLEVGTELIATMATVRHRRRLNEVATIVVGTNVSGTEVTT